MDRAAPSAWWSFAETRERSVEAREKLAAAITAEVARSVGVPPDAVLAVPPHSIPKNFERKKLRRDRTKQLYQAGSCGAPTRAPWLQVVRLALAGLARSVGRIARVVPEKLYGVYADLVLVALMVPAWAMVLPVRNRKIVAGIAVGGLRLCFLLMGSPIRVSGREHLTAHGACVLVSNHASYMDVLVLMAGLGTDFHIVSKSEVPQDAGDRNVSCTKLGHFWFDRADPQARLRQAEQIEQSLRQGESVLRFSRRNILRRKFGVRPRSSLGAFPGGRARRPPHRADRIARHAPAFCATTHICRAHRASRSTSERPSNHAPPKRRFPGRKSCACATAPAIGLHAKPASPRSKTPTPPRAARVGIKPNRRVSILAPN
jgi:hypothetical protein